MINKKLLSFDRAALRYVGSKRGVPVAGAGV